MPSTAPIAVFTPAPASFMPERLAFAQAPCFKRGMTLHKPHGLQPQAPQKPNYENLLVQVGAQRDRKAFIALFEYFAPRVKSYLLKHGATDAAAEEIVQNTFITVWEKATAYNPQKAAASTWIFTVARNKRIDALRREKFVEVNSDAPALENATYDAEETYATAEDAERLNAAIATLPPEQAELLRLAFFEDKSHTDISKETRIPLGTVKSRLRLALGKLRTLLRATREKGAAQ